MNCIDNECKHLYSYLGEYYCKLTKQEIPDDIDITQCKNFVQARTCINCIHSRETVYENGTIDDIEYRCRFQGKRWYMMIPIHITTILLTFRNAILENLKVFNKNMEVFNVITKKYQ